MADSVETKTKAGQNLVTGVDVAEAAVGESEAAVYNARDLGLL